MTAALDRPAVTGLFSHWALEPVALVLVVVLGAWYVRAAHRTRTRTRTPWPADRSVKFFAGLIVALWTTNGFLQAYADSVFWVWVTQTLVLWLGVPLVVLFGQPIQLARAVSSTGRLEQVLRSKPVRVLSNPLVGPALVPVLSFGLFFGPLPGWAIRWAAAGWVVHLALLAIGALMVLPLVGLEEDASSMAVGLSLAIGSVELVIDALPGIVMRLHHGLLTSYFDHRAAHPWSPGPQHDQDVAGAILWCVAELIDLPFLVLVYRRWLRADARDAAHIDAVLAAERAARRGLAPEEEPDVLPQTLADDEDERDTPWWLSDPAMVERLRRQR